MINLLHSYKPDDEPDGDLSRAETVDRSFNNPTEKGDFSLVDDGDGVDCRKLGDFSALFGFLSRVSPPEPDHALADQDTKKQNIINIKNVSGYDTVVGGEVKPKDGLNGKRLLKRNAASKSEGDSPHSKSGVALPEKLPLTTIINGSYDSLKQQIPQKSILRRVGANSTQVSVVSASPKPKASLGRSKLLVESAFTGSAIERKLDLVSLLLEKHSKDRGYLRNVKLCEPFPPVNTVSNGIHVFVDMSNVS